MVQLVAQLVQEFKKSPLPTICALLVGASVYLFLSLLEANEKLQKSEERRGVEVLEMVRKHSEEIRAIDRREAARTDSLQRIELEKTKQQNLELEGLIKDLRKIRKK